MIIDNFDILRPLLTFDDIKDDFYFCMILKRRKDPGNGHMERPQKIIDQITIQDIEAFDKLKDKVHKLCVDNNARCYLNLDKRSNEMIAMYTIRDSMQLVMNKTYEGVRGVYWKCVGKYASSHRQRRWLIDCDSDEDAKAVGEFMTGYDMTPVPTMNGLHYIINRFDSRAFKETFPRVDIKKDPLTMLYCIK